MPALGQKRTCAAQDQAEWESGRVLPLRPGRCTRSPPSVRPRAARRMSCALQIAKARFHGNRLLRLAHCLSQGDFWPAKTHRDPSGDEPQHELARETIIIRHVIGKLDAVSTVSCHDPHFKRRSACRKAVPVHRQPMSLGKVEEHSRIATCGNDPPRWGIRLEPVLFKILLPRHTMHSILSIQDVVRSAVRIEHGWRGRQLLEAATGFLATRAKAGGGQNRPPNCLQFYRTASAYLVEVCLLFLVQRNRPFVDSVYLQWIISAQKCA